MYTPVIFPPQIKFLTVSIKYTDYIQSILRTLSTDTITSEAIELFGESKEEAVAYIFNKQNVNSDYVSYNYIPDNVRQKLIKYYSDMLYIVHLSKAEYYKQALRMNANHLCELQQDYYVFLDYFKEVEQQLIADKIAIEAIELFEDEEEQAIEFLCSRKRNKTKHELHSYYRKMKAIYDLGSSELCKNMHKHNTSMRLDLFEAIKKIKEM